MKTTLFGLFALFFVLVSCEKDCEFDKYDKDYECELCQDTEFEDPFATYPDNIQQYIIEPIEQDPQTGFITKGLVKYVKDNDLVVMVNYGSDWWDKESYGDKEDCWGGGCDDDDEVDEEVDEDDLDGVSKEDWEGWGVKKYIYTKEKKKGKKKYGKCCKFKQEQTTDTNTAVTIPTNN